MAKSRKRITRAQNKSKSPEIKLIASDDKQPMVALKPGMRVEVTNVRIVDPSLIRRPKIAARLCGGSGTCIALIDLGEESQPAKGQR